MSTTFVVTTHVSDSRRSIKLIFSLLLSQLICWLIISTDMLHFLQESQILFLPQENQHYHVICFSWSVFCTDDKVHFVGNTRLNWLGSLQAARIHLHSQQYKDPIFLFSAADINIELRRLEVVIRFSWNLMWVSEVMIRSRGVFSRVCLKMKQISTQRALSKYVLLII